MKKLLFIFVMLVGTTGFTKAQNVSIPDANFKAYLLGNSRINTNGDNEISIAEASAYIGQINVTDKNITDLAGIEMFTKITHLICPLNQLTSLDVSKNTALTHLSCDSNQLTSLDLTKNTALTELLCGTNPLMNLDLSKNTALTWLNCDNNDLTSLDLSNNIALTNLVCTRNQLTNLDVTKNTNLQYLYCYENQLTTLNVSKNTALIQLYCFLNQLTSLDLSKNTALEYLLCFENQLIGLDISQNIILKYVAAFTNKLKYLNLSNGNNDKLSAVQVWDNSELTCIQVDNVTNANSYGTWVKDDTATYSENCLLSVNDINKKQFSVYPNPVKEILNFSEEVSNVKITDVSGRTIKAVSTTEKSVNISNLAKGMYVISAVTKSGEVVSKKIIKE